MFFAGRTGNKDVINIGIAELEATWSMKRWNVWAALRRPNGMRRNSKRPNGVVTAVFETSDGSTGI